MAYHDESPANRFKKSRVAFIRVALDIEDVEALDRLCERRGTTRFHAHSQLVRWFLSLDAHLQKRILGGNSSSEQELYARVLRFFSKKDGTPRSREFPGT